MGLSAGLDTHVAHLVLYLATQAALAQDQASCCLLATYCGALHLLLPAGRNIHALDPYRMPSPAATARGVQAAQAILDSHTAANQGVHRQQPPTACCLQLPKHREVCTASSPLMPVACDCQSKGRCVPCVKGTRVRARVNPITLRASALVIEIGTQHTKKG